nr:MAG TPA: hypothetical protein [Caudoviricetes sp.]
MEPLDINNLVPPRRLRRVTWRGKTLGQLVSSYLRWLDDQLLINGFDPRIVDEYESNLLWDVRQATGELVTERTHELAPANNLVAIRGVCSGWMYRLRMVAKELGVGPELRDTDLETWDTIRWTFQEVRGVKSRCMFLEDEVRHQTWFIQENMFRLETGIDR